jgi:probable phosphoglycerate mutase
MPLKLYFLRHGETTASRTGGYCGALDPDLTDEGRLMAEDFAAAYKALPWAAVYASPMRRTIATAKPFCDATGQSARLLDGLKEIAYGEWEGKLPDVVNTEYHDDYVRWLTDPGWNAPTGGERGVDVARRGLGAIETIQSDCAAGNVLVVSHKATIRVVLCALLGIDVGRFRERIAMPVSAVSVVEMTSNGPFLRVLGDQSHLRQSLLSVADK